MSRQLNLNIRTQGQLENSHTSPSGLWVNREHLIVDCIPGREVLHSGEKDIDFDDLETLSIESSWATHLAEQSSGSTEKKKKRKRK